MSDQDDFQEFWDKVSREPDPKILDRVISTAVTEMVPYYDHIEVQHEQGLVCLERALKKYIFSHFNLPGHKELVLPLLDDLDQVRNLYRGGK